MSTLIQNVSFLNILLARANTRLLFCFCCLLLVYSLSTKTYAQQQALYPASDRVEQSPSEKLLQALYEISTLTASTELPAHYQSAFQKLNTDFPLKQALGAAFDKGAIYAWLQKEPASIASVYELFSAYLSELKPIKPAIETDEDQKTKQKASYRSPINPGP